MTDEAALEILGLDSQASQEEMEKAYRKLLNRYPPEFHPEKYRRIDEAYRFMTSYPRRVATLLAPKATRNSVDLNLFRYSCAEQDELLGAGVREVRRLARLRYLWEE